MKRPPATYWSCLIVALAICAAAPRICAAQDLRRQYGTRSLAAAQALDEAIKLVQSEKADKSLPLFDQAISLDSKLLLAYYWKALAHFNVGDIDAALATYDKGWKAVEGDPATNVTVDLCINAGLTLDKVKRYEESRIWFTRAIVRDPTDQFGLRWKAFRNMAITFAENDDRLSALMCAVLGRLADPQHVERKMVEEYLEAADRDESARLLDFGTKPAQAQSRQRATELTAETAVAGIEGEISDLVVGPRQLIVTVKDQAKYYLVAGDQPATAVDVAGVVVAAALAGEELYLSLPGTGIAKVDLPTGKTLEEWGGAAPTSLAPLPGKGVILYPRDGLLEVLNLSTRKATASDYFAHAVAVDPRQEFCYTFVRREQSRTIGHVIIDGRPIIIQRAGTDWTQTALLKFAVVNQQPLLAEMRMNAASNGSRLCVSPDTHWVGVVGGGGWRPLNSGGHKSGYGVAVFAAENLEKIQGFYAAKSYPRGMAVNPATGQIATISSEEAWIADLAGGGEPVKLTGRFTGPAAWSPDGKFLYLATDAGLRRWANATDPTEVAPPVVLAAKAAASSSAPQAGSTPKAIAEYRKFAMANDRQSVLAVLAAAKAAPPGDLPQEWLRYQPYQQDAALRKRFGELVNQGDRAEAGLRIYQLKQLKAQHPDHVGVDFLLGMNYFFAGQTEQAKTTLLAVVRRDAGLTNITLESLRCLGQAGKREGDHLAAAFCYAHALKLDRSDEQVQREASQIFAAASLSEELKPLLDGAPVAASSPTAGQRLPALPVEQPGAALLAEKLFEQSAPSVVLIRTSRGMGSGACIAAPGYVLTNQHVVAGAADLKVTPYVLREGKLSPLDPLPARILGTSSGEDLAILQVANPPDSLKPLAFAAKPVVEGAKIFAIGHPGLGDEVLDQTITEGIVSSARRMLASRTYIQHTAAVNPGNSGGPLFDDRGQLVGIVTRKAGLENVSFAIPAANVQKFWEAVRRSPAQPRP